MLVKYVTDNVDNRKGALDKAPTYGVWIDVASTITLLQ